MSAFGTKRTFLIASAMSAIRGKADIHSTSLDVRIDPKRRFDPEGAEPLHLLQHRRRRKQFVGSKIGIRCIRLKVLGAMDDRPRRANGLRKFIPKFSRSPSQIWCENLVVGPHD